MKKKILYSILVILILIQFFRPEKNLSSTISTNDITNKYKIPAGIHETLKSACFDCHSNNTKYPWYSQVQPVGWWLQNHVNEGKEHLNFSEFLGYTPKKAHHKMEEMAEMVSEGEMPLNSYTWMHKNARLNAEQRKALTDWANETMSNIALANNLSGQLNK